MLRQAVAAEATVEYIDALLEELISCTDWHFRHEERLMLQYHYPDMTAHKSEHDALINKCT